MFGLRATATFGTIAFAPWVGLIGFDAGVWAGLLAAAGSTGLWLLASTHDHIHSSAAQIGGAGRLSRIARRGHRRRRAPAARERARAPLGRRAAVRPDRLDARRHLPHRPRREHPHPERAAAAAQPRARPAAGGDGARAAARDRAPHRRPGALPPADDGDRGVGRREHERRVRARGHGPRLPRLHGAGLRHERALRRPDLDAARGDRGPRARPHARRVRGHRLARAAHAADVDLGLPRDDAGRGGGPRRNRTHVPGRDPAQHRPAAPSRRGPAADRADRGAPGRARIRERSTSPSWRRSASRRSGRRRARRTSSSCSPASARRRSAATAAGSRRCSTTSSRTR